jgi:hypothetical protein
MKIFRMCGGKPWGKTPLKLSLPSWGELGNSNRRSRLAARKDTALPLPTPYTRRSLLDPSARGQAEGC